MEKKENCLYQFGPFRLDTAEHLLLRNKQRVHLAPKDFEILLLLVENRGHILGKEELLKRVWPNTFVEEGNLNRHISTLRKKLGESQDKPEYIETVPRVGYRFIANVRDSRGDGGVEEHTVARRARVTKARPRTRSIDSLAVLPFVNASVDESVEYLADGITDSVINTLSKLPQLRVMASSTVSRYKGADINPKEVARQIGVRAVVVGRLLQFGEKLIVKAELVDAKDGSQLWGERYSRNASDIFTVQEEISRQISNMLSLQLTNEQKRRLTERHTNNTEAYQQYLMGRFLINKRTPDAVKKGLKHFERAIELDSRFALAYVGLSESYTLLGYYNLLPSADFLPKARDMALRALTLVPHLAEAHIAMAHIKRAEWDWAGMEEEYQYALKINPNLPAVHQLYSVLLRQMGRFDECFAEIRQAQELDPISPNLIATAATNLYCARQYDTALEEILKVIELEPSMLSGHFLAGWIYTQQGKYAEAIEAFQRAGSLFEYENPEITANLACVYALSHRTKKARQLLDQLLERSQQEDIRSYHIALVYAALGDRDQAFAYLQKGCKERSVELAFLKVDPLLDSCVQTRGSPTYCGRSDSLCNPDNHVNPVK